MVRAEVPFAQRTAFAVLKNNFRQQTIFEEFNRTKFPWIYMCVSYMFKKTSISQAH